MTAIFTYSQKQFWHTSQNLDSCSYLLPLTSITVFMWCQCFAASGKKSLLSPSAGKEGQSLSDMPIKSDSAHENTLLEPRRCHKVVSDISQIKSSQNSVYCMIKFNMYVVTMTALQTSVAGLSRPEVLTGNKMHHICVDKLRAQQ